MGDEHRLTVKECWARLQQVDEALATIPADRGCMHRMGRLLENRQFFERQLERCLVRERYVIPQRRSKMTNNPKVDVNEVYGDGMGKSGNGAEQTDIALRSLNYKGRFGADTGRGLPAEQQAEIEKVRG